jgi:hypothetical protein
MVALRSGRLGRWARPTLWVLTLTVPALSIAAVLLGTGTLSEVATGVAPWEILLLLFLGFFEFWPLHYFPWIVRRIRGREEERVVSESGLDVAGSLDAAYVPWSEIRWVKETQEFFLFRGPRDAYFVPKRLLTENQLVQIRHLVIAHCAAPAQLLPGAGRAT